MGLFDLKLGKLNTSLYDLGTIAAGFYIGYNEGKGIPTGRSVEYMAKYGPTTLSLAVSPLMIKANYSFLKWARKKVLEGIASGNLKVTLGDNSKKKFKDLNKEQQQKVADSMKNIESKILSLRYIEPALLIGLKTSLETFVGYYAGRLYSQLN
ncbi:MAG: hypothetical protein V1660_02345 [archaeon]